MSETDHRTFRWWLIAQAIVIIAGGLIWYGTINTTLSAQSEEIHELKVEKAEKDLVQQQYKEIIRILDDVKIDIRDIKNKK